MHVDYTDVISSSPAAEARAQQDGRAERLLAEYLRMWGLRDPSTIAAHCRVWVREVNNTEVNSAEQSNAAADAAADVCRKAVDQAITDMNNWLDHLSRQSGGTVADVKARRGLLAIELQSSIDQYPGALLSYDLPAELAEQLRKAARPVVPPAVPTSMPDQPLGELVDVLRPQWWSRLVSGFTSAACRLIGFRLAR